MNEVRILNASLEEDLELNDIVIRGVVDQTTIKYINMAWYQREQGFSSKHINAIVAALFLNKTVADITIGMRGQRCKSDGDAYVLQDKCFCIDGGQRLYGAGLALKERPDLKINLGAKVIVGTTEEQENDLFCTLGSTQIRISPSVLLRNRKKKSAAAYVLVDLNKDARFALKDRIAWDQTKTRHELMAGYTLARIVGSLHAHKGGGLCNAKVYDLLKGLDDLVDKIGTDALRNNSIRFFDAIDKCWSIRNLSGGREEARPHLKPLFLFTIARLISAYADFWDGKERNDFYFPEKFVKKLRGFKLADYLQTSKLIPRDALYEILRKRLSLDPMFEEDLAAE